MGIIQENTYEMFNATRLFTSKDIRKELDQIYVRVLFSTFLHIDLAPIFTDTLLAIKGRLDKHNLPEIKFPCSYRVIFTPCSIALVKVRSDTDHIFLALDGAIEGEDYVFERLLFEEPYHFQIASELGVEEQVLREWILSGLPAPRKIDHGKWIFPLSFKEGHAPAMKGHIHWKNLHTSIVVGGHRLPVHGSILISKSHGEDTITVYDPDSDSFLHCFVSKEEIQDLTSSLSAHGSHQLTEIDLFDVPPHAKPSYRIPTMSYVSIGQAFAEDPDDFTPNQAPVSQGEPDSEECLRFSFTAKSKVDDTIFKARCILIPRGALFSQGIDPNDIDEEAGEIMHTLEKTTLHPLHGSPNATVLFIDPVTCDMTGEVLDQTIKELPGRASEELPVKPDILIFNADIDPEGVLKRNHFKQIDGGAFYVFT